MKTAPKNDVEVFKSAIARYKQLIDDDITNYLKHAQKTTLQQFGTHSRVAFDAFGSILERGGKRIRGALVMQGYEMCGGTNKQMIIQAARAVEMIHAYILILDDIQDRSVLRRGGDTAHIQLAKYHAQKQLADDADHFGEAIAINAAVLGNHAAHAILANLDADPQLRTNVISIMSRTMVVTAHGQTNDIMNEVTDTVTEKDVQNVQEWKTAHYSILNPLHVGMVLAGADCHATDAVTPYAMHTGLAFQITDDILGVFGTEHESGKSPMDDIREGKRTLLSTYALEHTEAADKNFLIQMLGNSQLTKSEFGRCKEILQSSGALAYSQTAAKRHIEQAIASLEDVQKHWSGEGTQFLTGLAQYLLTRTS